MDVGPDNPIRAHMFDAEAEAEQPRAGTPAGSAMDALLVGPAQVALAITIASLVLVVAAILWYLFAD